MNQILSEVKDLLRQQVSLSFLLQLLCFAQRNIYNNVILGKELIVFKCKKDSLIFSNLVLFFHWLDFCSKIENGISEQEDVPNFITLFVSKEPIPANTFRPAKIMTTRTI